MGQEPQGEVMVAWNCNFRLQLDGVDVIDVLATDHAPRLVNDILGLLQDQNADADVSVMAVASGCDYSNLGEISTINVEQGDTVVLHSDLNLTQESMAQIRKNMLTAFPECKCVVVPRGLSLSVIHEDGGIEPGARE